MQQIILLLGFWNKKQFFEIMNNKSAMFLLLQVVPLILSHLFIAGKDCSTIETISMRHPVYGIYGLPCRLMLLSHSAALRVKKLKAVQVYIKFQML